MICNYFFPFCRLSYKSFFLRFYCFFFLISNYIVMLFWEILFSLWDVQWQTEKGYTFITLCQESSLSNPALCAVAFRKHLFWSLLMCCTLEPTSGGIRWNSFLVSLQSSGQVRKSYVVRKSTVSLQSKESLFY